MTTTLKEQHRKAQAAVTEARRKAHEAWTARVDAEKKFGESGQPAEEGQSAFDDLAKANDVYRPLAEALARAEKGRDALADMLGEDAPAEEAKADDSTPEGEGRTSRRSFGDRVVKSATFGQAKQRLSENWTGRVDLGKAMSRDELKSVIAGSRPATSALMPQASRLPGVYEIFEPQLTLLDLVSVGTMDEPSVEWVRETVLGHAAVEVPEATTTNGTTLAQGVKPEANYEYEIQSARARMIVHWVPATRASLRDIAFLAALIDNRLTSGVRQRAQQQIIAGDGVGENLRGILNTTGVGDRAQAGDTLLDAIFKTAMDVEVSEMEATGIAMNPRTWQDSRLAKDANGQYLLAPPGVAGDRQVWSLPVVTNTRIPQNRIVVGAWSNAQFLIRDDLEVLASDSHANFFTSNLVAVLAEMRAAFFVPRPQAFSVLRVGAAS